LPVVAGKFIWSQSGCVMLECLYKLIGVKTILATYQERIPKYAVGSRAFRMASCAALKGKWPTLQKKVR
jgi:hypothetical protein